MKFIAIVVAALVSVTAAAPTTTCKIGAVRCAIDHRAFEKCNNGNWEVSTQLYLFFPFYNITA